MISAIQAESCTGCCACMNACPKNCIQMLPDDEGFIRPKVDDTHCIQCGICLKKCPVYTPVKIPETAFAEPHAAWSLNKETRFMSTSGGAFSEIARYVLDAGGVVFGARYGENHLIEHCMITSTDEIPLIRQSKYAQSTIGMMYRKVSEKLKEGNLVAFCGCPCQAAGLVAYLGKKPEKLLLLDFICRGINSPKAYQKYLEMLERKYQSPVTRVWFKNKEHGWNRFHTRIDFQNGEKYLKDRYTDLFMHGYIGGAPLYMRPSCHACKFKGKERLSDITLADFWGGGNLNKSFDTDEGTSLVIVHSDLGKKVLGNLTNRLFISGILDERVYAGNACTVKPPIKNKNREVFLKALDTMPFDKCMKKYAPQNHFLKRKILHCLSICYHKIIIEKRT